MLGNIAAALFLSGTDLPEENTVSRESNNLAALGTSDRLPWECAKRCFEKQIDYNYIEDRQLLEEANTSRDFVSLAEMKCRFLIIEPDFATPAVRRALEFFQGKVFWSEKDEAGAASDRLWSSAQAWGWRSQDPNLRVRRVAKDGEHFLMVFNECPRASCVPVVSGLRERWDPATGIIRSFSAEEDGQLGPFELGVWTLRLP